MRRASSEYYRSVASFFEIELSVRICYPAYDHLPLAALDGIVDDYSGERAVAVVRELYMRRYIRRVRIYIRLTASDFDTQKLFRHRRIKQYRRAIRVRYAFGFGRRRSRKRGISGGNIARLVQRQRENRLKKRPVTDKL